MKFKCASKILCACALWTLSMSVKSYAFTTDIIPQQEADKTFYGNRYAFEVEFGADEITGFTKDDIELSSGKVSMFTDLKGGKYFILISDVDKEDDELEIEIPGGTARTKDGEDGNDKASLKIKLDEDRLSPQIYLSVSKKKDRYEAGDVITIGIYSGRENLLIDNGAQVSFSGAFSGTVKLEPDKDEEVTFNNRKVSSSYSAKYTIPYGSGILKFSVNAKDMAGNAFNNTPLDVQTILCGRSELVVEEVTKNFAGTKLTFKFNDILKSFDKTKILIDGISATDNVKTLSDKTMWEMQLTSPLPDTTKIKILEGAATNSAGLKNSEKEFSVECSNDSSEYKTISKEISAFELTCEKIRNEEEAKKFLKEVNDYYTKNKANLSAASIKVMQGFASKVQKFILDKCEQSFIKKIDNKEKMLVVSVDKDMFNKFVDIIPDLDKYLLNLGVINKTESIKTKMDFNQKIDINDYKKIKFDYTFGDVKFIEDNKIKFVLENKTHKYTIPYNFLGMAESEGKCELIINEDCSVNVPNALMQLGNSFNIVLRGTYPNGSMFYKDLNEKIEIEINKDGLYGNVPSYLKGYFIPFDKEKGELKEIGNDFNANITPDGAKFSVRETGVYLILKSNTVINNNANTNINEKNANSENIKFTDVPNTHWAKKYIDKLVEKNITTGLTKTTFGPSSFVTRAQAASFLVRARNYEEVKYSNKFKDVANGKWYTNAVLTAASNDIITGYKDNTFKPNDNLTRQEMIVMIVRAYCKDKNVTVASINANANPASKFKDKSKISSWAMPEVGAAYKLGIISGDKNGNFNPLNKITRAEVAKILIEYLNLIEE